MSDLGSRQRLSPRYRVEQLARGPDETLETGAGPEANFLEGVHHLDAVELIDIGAGDSREQRGRPKRDCVLRPYRHDHRGGAVHGDASTWTARQLLCLSKGDAEADADRRNFMHETAAIEHVGENITVSCAPIVPTVQQSYSAYIESADEPITLPGGIHIGAGARDITIKNARVVIGNLMDRSADYKARNPKALDQGAEQVAGEDLITYAASDYTMALGFVSRFVDQALSNLDLPVKQTLEELRS
jgi:hypothetical protein